MAKKLRKIECDDPCNFSVTSRDEDELIEHGLMHMKNKHGITYTQEQIKEMRKTMIKDA